MKKLNNRGVAGIVVIFTIGAAAVFGTCVYAPIRAAINGELSTNAKAVKQAFKDAHFVPRGASRNNQGE